MPLFNIHFQRTTLPLQCKHKNHLPAILPSNSLPGTERESVVCRRKTNAFRMNSFCSTPPDNELDIFSLPLTPPTAFYLLRLSWWALFVRVMLSRIPTEIKLMTSNSTLLSVMSRCSVASSKSKYSFTIFGVSSKRWQGSSICQQGCQTKMSFQFSWPAICGHRWRDLLYFQIFNIFSHGCS